MVKAKTNRNQKRGRGTLVHIHPASPSSLLLLEFLFVFFGFSFPVSSHVELYCKGSESSVCLKISLSVFCNRRKSKSLQFQILCLLWVHPGKEMHCFNGSKFWVPNKCLAIRSWKISVLELKTNHIKYILWRGKSENALNALFLNFGFFLLITHYLKVHDSYI